MGWMDELGLYVLYFCTAKANTCVTKTGTTDNEATCTCGSTGRNMLSNIIIGSVRDLNLGLLVGGSECNGLA
jgi:hypothetical protein